MGRRVQRRSASRRVLGLAHPAEGVALGVAGVLVAATLYSAVTASTGGTTPAPSTATPTSSLTLGSEDVAGYPSPLLLSEPSPERPAGSGVRMLPRTATETTEGSPTESAPPAETPTTAPPPAPSATESPAPEPSQTPSPRTPSAAPSEPSATTDSTSTTAPPEPAPSSPTPEGGGASSTADGGSSTGAMGDAGTGVTDSAAADDPAVAQAPVTQSSSADALAGSAAPLEPSAS